MRKHRIVMVSLGLLAWLGASPIAQRSTVGVLAFTHVTVIDGTGASPRRDQTVLVTRDRITAVGAFKAVRIPSNARTIDGMGRFLIPGLWDTHIHTRYEGVDHLRLLIANGLTSARNMSGPWPHLAEIREWREQIASEHRVGPRLITAQKIPFLGHVPLAVSALEASNAGQVSLEHLDGILISASAQEEQLRRQAEGWRPDGSGRAAGPISAKALVGSFSSEKLRGLAEQLAANKTAVVPTLSLNWNRFAQSIVRSPDRLRYVPVSYAGEWQRAQSTLGSNSEDDMRAHSELGFVVVRELHRAGVPILAGTDVGTAYQIPGFSLHDELSLLVKAGLSEMEALQAATRDPARVFKLPNQGTVENGKAADLVLLDANPLENIENTRRIRLVVAAGRVFDRSYLDGMLADIEKNAREWTGTPTR